MRNEVKRKCQQQPAECEYTLYVYVAKQWALLYINYWEINQHNRTHFQVHRTHPHQADGRNRHDYDYARNLIRHARRTHAYSLLVTWLLNELQILLLIYKTIRRCHKVFKIYYIDKIELGRSWRTIANYINGIMKDNGLEQCISFVVSRAFVLQINWINGGLHSKYNNIIQMRNSPSLCERFSDIHNQISIQSINSNSLHYSNN